MTTEGESDQNAVIRGILAGLASGELAHSDGTTDSVAQLLTAALAQVGQTILNPQSTSQAQKGTDAHQKDEQDAQQQQTDPGGDNFAFNPQEAVSNTEEEGVHSTATSSVEVLASNKAKPLCIKFPIELRKRIISMRKEGKKCKDIAKELKISISGAQKVWERFLATGRVHDRKPSTYAGRPRKYTYSQEGVPSPTVDDTNYNIGQSIEVFQTGSNSPTQIEYVATPEGGLTSEAIETTVIITSTGDSSDLISGGPLDMPGATVEIVASDPLPLAAQHQHKLQQKGAPAYRQQLILRLVEGCPLATMQAAQSSDASRALHVENLASSVHKPLYMEYVLGHPFGKAPPSKPFEANTEEAQIICTDPADPLAKDLLAALGYSTKVYFNACCKPSSLFDPSKVTSNLPFSIGPGYLGETTQKVLQLLLDLCMDPVSALYLIPAGDGPLLVATSVDGEMKTKMCSAPTKLSDYWCNLYALASKLKCCENFLSAAKPSAPCLICHPFESLMKQLEIKDPDDQCLSPTAMTVTDHVIRPLTATPTMDPHDQQQVEIQVLESGQVTLSPVTSANSATTTSSTTIGDRRGMKRGGGRGKELAQIIANIGSTQHQFQPGAEQSDGGVSVDTQTSSVVSEASTGEDGSETQAHSSSTEQGVQTQEMVVHQDVQCVGDAVTPKEHKNTTAGVNASTQTPNASVRPEREDRTPLIIRRNRTPQTASSTNTQLSQTAAKILDMDQCGSGTEQSPANEEQEAKSNGVDSEIGIISTQEAHVQTHTHTQSQTDGPSVSDEGATQESVVDEESQQPSDNKQGHTPMDSSPTVAALVEGEPKSNDSEMGEKSAPRLRRSTRRSVKSQKAQSSSPSANTSPSKRTPSPKKKQTPSPKKQQQSSRSASSGRATKRALGLGSNKEGDETTTTNSPPPVKRTRRTRSSRGEYASGRHPLSWSVEDVAEFVGGVPQCECTDVFREHEVDGESFLALTPEIMVKLMDLKAGPAIRLHNKIIELKQQFDIPTSRHIS